MGRDFKLFEGAFHHGIRIAELLLLRKTDTASVAKACQVPLEVLESWIAGTAIPRYSKMTLIAEALGCTLGDLLGLEEPPLLQLRFAYHLEAPEDLVEDASSRAEDIARHILQLRPYLPDAPLFEPPQLCAPGSSREYAHNVAKALRAVLMLTPLDHMNTVNLEKLYRVSGIGRIPVDKGPDAHVYETALALYLPESKQAWVVVNVRGPKSEYNFALAKALGHCLVLPSLPEGEAREFAVNFAEYLIYPQELATQCAKAREDGLEQPTVRAPAPNAGPRPYAESTLAWLCGETAPGPNTKEFLAKMEAHYETPVYRALGAFQVAEGGRNVAVIATTLGIPLHIALAISHELWSRRETHLQPVRETA